MLKTNNSIIIKCRWICHGISLPRLWLSITVIALLLALQCLGKLDINFREKDKNRRLLASTSSHLNVLTFGGSTTWGAMLENRDMVYPSLLAEDPRIDRSDNLAIRATSAVWPSQCLQTMIYEQGTADIEYNVVLLEFSVNGVTGLSLLLARIRTRYPSALIIYIDLYSNRRPGWSNCLGEKCRTNPVKQQALYELVKSFDGHMVSLPRPVDPMKVDDVSHFFANDLHHLGPQGHQWVRDQVMPLIRDNGQLEIPIEIGNWREGDLCANWFESGAVSTLVELNGGDMTPFAQNKYAYEIQSEAMLQISTEQLQAESPLIFFFMTKGNPSLYPLLKANLDGNASMTVVNPLNPRWATDHVTSSQAIGTISPGQIHRIRLKNLEPTKTYPFRLVGIVMCAACKAMNVDLAKTCRMGCMQTVNDD